MDCERWGEPGCHRCYLSSFERVVLLCPNTRHVLILYCSLFSKVLRGRLRLKPSPPDGIFPFLHHTTKGTLGHDAVLHVSFTPQQDRQTSGRSGFTDYSVRYCALWDENRKTLQESLLEALSLDPPLPPPTEFDTTRKDPPDEEKTRQWNERIEDLADRLYLVDKLDLPPYLLLNVSLSNGLSHLRPSIPIEAK